MNEILFRFQASAKKLIESESSTLHSEDSENSLKYENALKLQSFYHQTTFFFSFTSEHKNHFN